MKRILIWFLLLNTSCSSYPINQDNSNVKSKKPEIKPQEIFVNTDKIKNELISNTSEKPKFDNAKVVKEGIRNSYIYLIFKDEHKVRIKGLEEKIFKSLLNKDLSQINNLLVKYNVKQVDPHDSYFSKSE